MAAELPRGRVRARDWDDTIITGQVSGIHRDLADPTVGIRVEGDATGTRLRYLPLSRIIAPLDPPTVNQDNTR